MADQYCNRCGRDTYHKAATNECMVCETRQNNRLQGALFMGIGVVVGAPGFFIGGFFGIVCILAGIGLFARGIGALISGESPESE